MSPDPAALENLDERVIETITRHQRLEPGRVTMDSTFADLGIDSLDGIELVFEFEEQFNLSIPDEVARNMRSVRQVVDALRQALETPAHAEGDGRSGSKLPPSTGGATSP